MTTIPWHRRVIYVAIVLALFYGAIEIAATWLWMRGTIEPESHWVYESNESGWSYAFDPILGYATSRVPSRLATTATNGTVECTGTIRGNNLGFPDDDDLTPGRSDPSRKRVAVFGDSFTAGYYIERPWTEAAEEAAPAIDFMNLGVDGGGLTNWWSVATRLLGPGEYDLDGVVFAVFGDDLFRPFSIYDDRHEDGRIRYGRVPFASIRDLPRSRDAAGGYLEPVERFDRVSPERFDALLRGEWHPKSGRSFRPFFASRFLSVLRGAGETSDGPPVRRFQTHHEEIFTEIRAVFEQRGIPTLVVYLPWRDEVLGGGAAYGSPREAKEFADRIGADFADGSEAFAGLTAAEVRDCWLRYDGHFSQAGMDRFGGYVAGRVGAWLDPGEATSE